jgi:L-aminopeptidase/D-esterase-like protein
MTVERIDAIAISGGSAFGLDTRPACRLGWSNKVAALPSARAMVPIVPGAVLFDLLNGGDEVGPLSALSRVRLSGGGSGCDFALGSVGAGLGDDGQSRAGLARHPRTSIWRDCRALAAAMRSAAR